MYDHFCCYIYSILHSLTDNISSASVTDVCLLVSSIYLFVCEHVISPDYNRCHFIYMVPDIIDDC